MNTKIAEILGKIIDGDPCYRLDGQYIRWGAVECDLNEVVAEVVKQREQEIVECLRKGFRFENGARVVYLADPQEGEALADILSEWLEGR